MSGAERYPHLLAAGRIGTMTLRNRIVMTPMGDLLANGDGSVSDAQVRYYEARASGGAAMVVVGSMQPAYPLACLSPNDTAISDRRYLPGLERLATAVHRHGARIAAQVKHIGQYALEDVSAGRPLLVPSVPASGGGGDEVSLLATEEELAARTAPFRLPGARLEYREATEADLAWVVDRFCDAAELAVEAGFDGIELHAGHGYLIDMFLSPATNRRADRWGGSLDNRARLLTTTARAVRARVGPHFPVWCRLNGCEPLTEGGETVEDAVATARLAVAAGLDAVHVTANADQRSPLGVTAGHTPQRPGALLPYAAAVKRAVPVPVICVGRIEPEVGEAAIARGDADFVAMGRKLLADPDLPRKLLEGREPDVRPCIYHYRCVGNGYLRKSVVCAVNPATGREGTPGAQARGDARWRHRVLVVGGGPAGLETARRLAEGGHAVTLAERSGVLGGRLRLAAWADPDLGPYLDWLVRGVEQAGVRVLLHRAVGPGDDEALSADAVVVAVGARPARAGIATGVRPGTAVRTLDDLAAWPGSGVSPGARVAVLGGGKAGLSVAAAAARQGSAVLVVEPSSVVAGELGPPGRAELVAQLEAAGVRLVAPASVEGITESGVGYRDRDGLHRWAADAVVTTALEPDPTLAAWSRPGLWRVGDCVAGSTSIESAVAAAARVRAELDRRRAPGG